MNVYEGEPLQISIVYPPSKKSVRMNHPETYDYIIECYIKSIQFISLLNEIFFNDKLMRYKVSRSWNISERYVELLCEIIREFNH